jgi:hypothetical protein
MNPLLQERLADLVFLVDFAQLDVWAASETSRRRDRARFVALLNDSPAPDGARWRQMIALEDFPLRRDFLARTVTEAFRRAEVKNPERVQPFGAPPAYVRRQLIRREEAILQRQLFTMFTELAGQKPKGDWFGFDFEIRLKAEWDGAGLTLWAVTHASLRNRVLYAAYTLVREVGREKLQVCRRPDCGHLFVKVGKKEFCSTKCQSRQYMREYRA